MSGKKAELQERLREHFLNPIVEETTVEPNMDEFDAMSDEDLLDAVKARSLPTTGTREELLGRIRDDITYANALLETRPPKSRNGYIAISQALEEAAKKEGGALAEYLDQFKLKSKETPKFMDVTITSLDKLEPEIFTAGGAPSVTANVLKNLAGDPFADPPKYGSVSFGAACVLRKEVRFLEHFLIFLVSRHTNPWVKKDAKLFLVSAR